MKCSICGDENKDDLIKSVIGIELINKETLIKQDLKYIKGSLFFCQRCIDENYLNLEFYKENKKPHT